MCNVRSVWVFIQKVGNVLWPEMCHWNFILVDINQPAAELVLLHLIPLEVAVCRNLPMTSVRTSCATTAAAVDARFTDEDTEARGSCSTGLGTHGWSHLSLARCPPRSRHSMSLWTDSSKHVLHTRKTRQPGWSVLLRVQGPVK